jgi:hypothetical protein
MDKRKIGLDATDESHRLRAESRMLPPQSEGRKDAPAENGTGGSHSGNLFAPSADHLSRDWQDYSSLWANNSSSFCSYRW